MSLLCNSSQKQQKTVAVTHRNATLYKRVAVIVTVAASALFVAAKQSNCQLSLHLDVHALVVFSHSS